MSHHAHDVRLLAGRVEGILHRLAIERQGLVVHPPGLIPGLERPIQGPGVNADETIADDKLTRDDAVSVLTPTPEAHPGLLPQAIGPIGDRLVPAHAAERGTRREAQHHGRVSFRIDVACASANKATVRPAH